MCSKTNMATNWMNTAFRELKHIDLDVKRYLKEPKLHSKPRHLLSFIFVIHSLEAEICI